MTTEEQLWTQYCRFHRINERGVPLFDITAENTVSTTGFGKDERQVLQISGAMRDRLIEVVREVVGDDSAGGLIYLMYRQTPEGSVWPLYIGKAQRSGRNGGISANLDDIANNTRMFARWGQARAYHIGELSAAVCSGYGEGAAKPRYRNWARELFGETEPGAALTLTSATYFWVTSWPGDRRERAQGWVRPTLASQETELIRIASLVNRNLLNIQGRARRRQ